MLPTLLRSTVLVCLVLFSVQAQAAGRESDLAKCQATLEKESVKQKQQEQKSYHSCLSAVRKDTLVKKKTDPSDKSIAKCQKELRKIKDTRGQGLSHGEKTKSKIMKACDPATHDFTDEDVVKEMTGGGDKGLGGEKLSEHCAAKNGQGVVDTAEKLVDCVVESNKKDSREGVKNHNAESAKDLKTVREKIALNSPPPDDPTSVSDAVEAADDALEQIDPDGDGEPNPVAPFDGAARIAFVSSVTYDDGDFNGSGFANAECFLMALAAGLPGHYLAWMSDSDQLAPDELSNLTFKPLIPYVTTTGVLVANSLSDFVSGGLVAPINVDENGTPVADDPVWTGTDAVGDSTATNCLDFNSQSAGETGGIGRTSLSDAGWTDAGTQTCDLSARIYCIELDDELVLPPPP